MKFKPIRRKIFLAMILVSTLPLTITSGIIFYQANRNLDEDLSFARVRIEQDLKDRISDYLEELNETAYQIYSNNDLTETIALNKEFLSDSHTYDTVKDIQQFFFSVYYQSRVKDIVGMVLLRNNGDLLGDFYPAVHPYLTGKDYQFLLEQTRIHDYRPQVLVRYNSPYQEPTIQFLYPVRYLGNPSGLLVIDMKEQKFREQIERYNVFYHGEILLTDPSGQIVYDTDSRQAGQLIAKTARDNKTVVIETSLDKVGWKLYYRYQMDPRQVFYRSFALSVIVISGLLAVILSFSLSFHLTKPIVRLHRSMRSIQGGDYAARVDVSTLDEIGFLSHQFNKMAETIQQFIDHDLKLRLMNKDSQIKALKAQISPHFLFNTLQMMAGIAELNRIPDLKLICQSLGGMYQYNMNIHHDWVPMRDEIMHIRNYMVIINKRYKGTIRFKLDMDGDAYECRIPKLILQPIVENAVEHGLMPSTRRRKLLKLTIRVDRVRNCLTILAIDNGIGTDDIHLLSPDGPGEWTSPNVGEEPSIGLSNVHARIRLLCGEPYGIRLISRKGAGTCVQFTLPLKEAEA